METTIELDPSDGVFELPGTEPAWISVHTCSAPKCACRSALVLACTEGRDVLFERHAAVHDAWVAGAGYGDVASQLDRVDVFQLDIDTAEISSPASGEPLDLAGYPAARTVVERLDGEVLDAIGRLWYRGKCWPDPEVRALQAPEIVVHGWRPGDLLAWNEVLEGVRQDYYVLGDRLYEASELYCSALGCKCGEVVIDFETRTPRGAPSPGRVVVGRSGTAKIEAIGKPATCSSDCGTHSGTGTRATWNASRVAIRR